MSTARDLFTTRGYEGTKIADISDSLGVSKAAVSYYFRTKDTFLDELVEPFVRRVEALIEESHDSRWPTGVRMTLAAYLEILIDDAQIARWVDSDLAVQAEHHFGDRLQAINEALVSLITNHDPTDAKRVRAFAVLGGLWRPVLQMSEDGLREHRHELLDAAMVSYAPLS